MNCVALTALFALSMPAQQKKYTIVPDSPGAVSAPAAANMPSTPTAGAREFDVPGARQWLDTQLDLKAGDTVKFTGSGSIRYAGAPAGIGPAGGTRGWTDLLRAYPLNDVPKGALLGKIGDRDTSRPFLIGTQREQKAGLDGRLFLGVNQLADNSADGSFHVRVEITKGTAMKPGAVSVKLTQEQLDSIPHRVQDKEGTPGDRVNFIVAGSEIQLKDALKNAGWTTVDATAKDAVFRGILASVSKQAYVTLPMSTLFLFGRGQDYGYAQADPLKVVAARHHFRIWKAPFTIGGQIVWAGAGTHDIGFDRDQRNNGVTHKIDPDTDLEREYIAGSLAESGNIALTEYMTVTDPIKDAKTAHGEAFKSDGRTVVLYFTHDTSDTSGVFADYFCSVLANNPDTGSWGDCGQYLEENGKTGFKLPELSTKYRVLIVPGFMSSCFAESPAFMEGQEVLKSKYNIDVNLLAAPNDSSEDNAKMIGDYLRENGPKDTRKYILVGYSKGTPDLQVALAKQNISGYVAAFISVAGASGGSAIADALPAMADGLIRQYFKMQSCKGDLTSGFKSLKRSERQAFLGAYPDSPVPSYSIVAFSEKTNTSKALLQSWEMLAGYDKRQDGQLTQSDAIVPGSKYLGAARGDHFAVALPFDKSKDPAIRGGMDKTRFPRAALLESLLCYVMHDLDGK